MVGGGAARRYRALAGAYREHEQIARETKHPVVGRMTLDGLPIKTARSQTARLDIKVEPGAEGYCEFTLKDRVDGNGLVERRCSFDEPKTYSGAFWYFST